MHVMNFNFFLVLNTDLQILLQVKNPVIRFLIILKKGFFTYYRMGAAVEGRNENILFKKKKNYVKKKISYVTELN